MSISLLEAFGRLAVAALLSGVVGFEREAAHKAAGLRTHMLVGLGAALFGLLSLEGFDAPDPSRIAAQVVTGIGFLGAGAIFREGALVRGLTTAAGLWAVAAIGLTAGAGLLALATVATAVAVLLLYVPRAVAERFRRIRQGRPIPVEVTLADVGALVDVGRVGILIDPALDEFSVQRDEDEIRVHFEVDPGKLDDITEALRGVEGVRGVERLD
ncbi:MAG: MgtC/SapB family protein [Acidimicrobiia bacterium]